jgi:superfamily I DNA/RNA helicase
LKYRVLDDRVETASGQVSISAMHLAKGLEFRAVAVMACEDEVIPKGITRTSKGIGSAISSGPPKYGHDTDTKRFLKVRNSVSY